MVEVDPENSDFDPDDRAEAGACWRALALAVLCKAGKDASRGNLAALRWLRKIDENDPWLAISGANGKAIREWVANGCKRQSNRRAPIVYIKTGWDREHKRRRGRPRAAEL